MPKVKTVEKRIREIEGISVHLLHSGKNVRGDAEIPAQYAAKKMTRNSFTVNDLKNKLRTQFPGYDFDVRKANGSRAPGQMKLATLRDTYLSEDD